MNVRVNGAVGDGRHKDTAAIQETIDTCADAGGGRVIVPAGTYLTGTLFLRDNVNLHLDAGARLLASPDREDYNPDDVFPENPVFSRENVTGAHLLIAFRVHNVTLSGSGIIDGNSAAFFGPPTDGCVTATYLYKVSNYVIRDWRPGQMVYFCQCRNVAVRDLSLLNAPYWTLFLHGCTDCRIRGLRIENPPQTQNGDGIDIDCCQRVTVSDCLIRSGDDSLTVRGYDTLLGDGVPCEDITVSNCVLSSPCNAVRVGVGNGRIRRVRMNNLVFSEARVGINIVCRYPRSSPPGTPMSDIDIANVTMDCLMPLHIRAGAGSTPPAGLHNLGLCDFTVRCRAGACIAGSPAVPLRDLRLHHWTVEAHGGTDDERFLEEIPDPFPPFGACGVAGHPGALPCVLFGRRLDGVSIRDFRVRWGAELGAVWRDALHFEACRGISIADSTLPAAAYGGKEVRLDDCHACRRD